MKLLSVNVGLPREIEWQGKLVRTSIFKSPVSGNVRVKTLNLEGDEQSDLSVHGGVHKAVYAYPSEHYRFWREEVPGIDLPLGVFGENFTIPERDLWVCRLWLDYGVRKAQPDATLHIDRSRAPDGGAW